MHHVSCALDGRSVLEDISLRLAPGMTVILGENGAGKSSLLRCLAGGIKPARGRVLFQGKELSSYRLHELARRRAILLQDRAIHFPFTALELVRMGRHPRNPNGASFSEDSLCEEALTLFGVHHVRQRIFSDLSGGERQRVQLARAVAQIWKVDGACLLLDEPTSALDLKHRFRVLQAIKRLAMRRGITVVCVMHDIHLLSRFFDQVVLLRRGRLLAAGGAETVLNVDNLEKTYDTRIERIKDERGRSCFVNA